MGGRPAEWSLAPGADRSRVLLYFHGGGDCSGPTLSHRRLVTVAGRAAGIRTLALEYRLAPANPFPALSSADRFMCGCFRASAPVHNRAVK